MDINITKLRLQDELEKRFPKTHFNVQFQNNRIVIYHDNEDELDFSNDVASVAYGLLGGNECIDILIDPS